MAQKNVQGIISREKKNPSHKTQVPVLFAKKSVCGGGTWVFRKKKYQKRWLFFSTSL